MRTDPSQTAEPAHDRLRPAIGVANGLALGFGIWCVAASVWLVGGEAPRASLPTETGIPAHPDEPAPSA